MSDASPADRRARVTHIALWSMAAVALGVGWVTQSWWTMVWFYYAVVLSMMIGQRIQRIGR